MLAMGQTGSLSEQSSGGARGPRRLYLRIPTPVGPRHQLNLKIRLASDPLPLMSTIGSLIVGGTLTCPVELACETAVAPNEPIGPSMYFRYARFAMSLRDNIVVSAEGKGQTPTVVLKANLDRFATLEALRALAGRPSWLQVSVRSGTQVVTTTLADLMRSITGDLGQWVTLVAPDPVSGEYRSVPPRVVQRHARSAAFARPAIAPFGHGFATIATVAAVNRLHQAPASALAAHAAVVTPGLGVTPIRPLPDNEVVFPPVDIRLHVPRIDDAESEVWSDSIDPSRYWYLPTFAVIQPDPARLASEAPFLFRFEQTGHGVTGQAGINATVMFTVQQTMSEVVAQHIKALGSLPITPVAFDSVAVSLLVPFRDDQGQTRNQSISAATTRVGNTIVATVRLLDNWARLAYGALAVDGFQAEPARVRIDACFQAMAPTRVDAMPLVLATKYERLHLSSVAATREFGGGAAVTAGIGTIQFAAEPENPPRAALARPLVGAQSVAVHAQLHGQVLVNPGHIQPVYGLQTIWREREIACLFPCDTLGALYLETTAQGDIAVGCRDALQLGQTEYRQYGPVTDAQIPPDVQVFRSLIQPGRFLLVPARYNIVRFGADAGDRAYRPAAFLYSSLDATKPENNRCVLMATLGPDVPPHEIERLRDLLRDLSPMPIVEYLTEIAAEVSYAWSLPNSDVIRDYQAVRLWDSFQLSLAVDITQAPLLESMVSTGGISIAATFVLPDKSSFQTTLGLDLNAIVGPSSGPAEAGRVADGVRLTNRIEVDIDVDDVLVVDDHAAPGRSSIWTVPVEETLKPAAAITIVAAVPEGARLVPVATPKRGTAATLAEVRSFVEDIYTQIAFVNLINYANHGLAAIVVEARIQKVPGTKTLAVSETQQVGLIEIVLPLTEYLAHPVLQFQVTLTKRDQSVQKSAWIEWPLETKGNVVGLTWELAGVAN
jgi:hypothetical protein